MLQRSNLIRGFLVYLLILMIMVLFFVLGVLRFFSVMVFNQVESELEHSGLMLKNLLLYEHDREGIDYDAFCKTAGAEGDTRITIIASDGTVLGDSHAEIAGMNNHNDRPEIIQAFRGSKGVFIRYSSTVGYKLMYFALPLKVGDDEIVLRTSRSLGMIDDTISGVSFTLLSIGVVFFFLAIYTAISTGKWIRRPLRHLVSVASALKEGELSARADVRYPDELRILGQTLNSMAGRLARRIESIQRQRDEYQSVLAGMSEAVIVLDANLRVIETNPAAERTFARGRSDMMDQPVLTTVRNLRVQEFAQELLQGTDSQSEEFTLHVNEGGERVRHLQVHGAALPRGTDTPEQPKAILVFTDITDIKQSEQIRKDFVSNVSHELKTPITSIKGFVETLLDGAGEDPEILKRFLEIIAKQANNMNAIIEDLLQLSWLDERSLAIGDSLVDMNDVIHGALDRINSAARQKSMAVRRENMDGNVLVRGNPGLLEQAVFNLMDNAVKYSGEGGEIQITLRSEGKRCILTVKDKGIGIPSEDLPRIFERFYRVDKARSRETGGTGLGLAIVKHIVRVHGGNVSVSSTPGKGADFVIELPLSDLELDGD